MSGCGRSGSTSTTYVPDTERLFFVRPGDSICEPNGAATAIPYKGIVLSNQRYMELLAGE